MSELVRRNITQAINPVKPPDFWSGGFNQGKLGSRNIRKSITTATITANVPINVINVILASFPLRSLSDDDERAGDQTQNVARPHIQSSFPLGSVIGVIVAAR